MTLRLPAWQVWLYLSCGMMVRATFGPSASFLVHQLLHTVCGPPLGGGGHGMALHWHLYWVLQTSWHISVIFTVLYMPVCES